MRLRFFRVVTGFLMMLSVMMLLSAQTYAAEYGYDEAASEDKIEKRVCEKPAVLSQITKRSRQIKVYLYQSGTLRIKNGNETVFEHTYRKSGLKTIQIGRVPRGTKLTFQMKNRYGSSGVVTKRVLNQEKKIPLKKPQVTADEYSLSVKGKLGARIYVKAIVNGKAGKWKYFDIITDRGWTSRLMKSRKSVKSLELLVRLKDLDGKYSGVARVSVPIDPETGETWWEDENYLDFFWY